MVNRLLCDPRTYPAISELLLCDNTECSLLKASVPVSWVVAQVSGKNSRVREDPVDQGLGGAAEITEAGDGPWTPASALARVEQVLGGANSLGLDVSVFQF
jgi:hypothetical protein